MDPTPDVEITSLLAELAREVQALRTGIHQEQRRLLKEWDPYLQNRNFLPGAANLAAYICLRRRDLRDLQSRLGAFGLSSLGRSEGRVLATLDSVYQALKVMLGKRADPVHMKQLMDSLSRKRQLLQHNTERLLGDAPTGRAVRIMVTLPSQAADDYVFVRELVTRGMDCARINCAHDDANAWESMIRNIKRASLETHRNCTVLMDLAGPKLRTGDVVPGPSVIHLKPKRDIQGRVVRAAKIILDSSGNTGHPPERDLLGRHIPARLAVPPEWLNRLQPADIIQVVDYRGRPRELTVRLKISDHEVMADTESGIYITPETSLTLQRDEETFSTVCGPIAAAPMDIRVAQGDAIRLTRSQEPGKPTRFDAESDTVIPAHIPCIPPEVFEYLAVGQPVWIDDGRIGASIEVLDEEGALLRINRLKPEGEKIKPEKGLNFPESHLGLPALTEKDLQDLDFVVAHADMVGFSFVQSGEDMDRLIDALASRNARHLGIVAKIETRRAVHNLPEIIVHGAGRHPFGVMIARGDLAIEIGYERLAEIQEEILWLCEAAQVPVIWATQVLENLIKRGMPSRAEITDAAMGERAECVMINKGPFVLDAIAVLDDVVERMEAHQHKKTATMRALHW